MARAIPNLQGELMPELTFVITKASLDKATGEMRWSAVASDTDWDSYNQRMSKELFLDFIRRAESKEVPPGPFCTKAWSGGMPYMSVSHYPDLEGKGLAGECTALFVDGKMLKAKGTFYDSPLGRACFQSICKDLYSEQKSRTDKIRISIGFLDWEHAHNEVRFERKSLTDRCPMCAEGLQSDVTYLKGHLLHLALTRVPVNRRTDIEPENVEVDKAMTTRKEDAASIIGEELAEELDHEASLVGKSEAIIERSEEPVEAQAEEGKPEEEPVAEVADLAVVAEEQKSEADPVLTALQQLSAQISELVELAKKKPMKKDEEDEAEEDEACGKKKKSHVLDPVFESLRSEFDRVKDLQLSDGEKLNQLQEPYAQIAIALRSELTQPEPASEEAPQTDPRLDEILSGIQRLNDRLTLLETTNKSAAVAQQPLSSPPQRRSIAPQVQKSLASEQKKDSFQQFAERSVGLTY